ncbi:hypothetical protein PBY51_013998 [Eleginops maclovinus]|uniref:Uncharacterized protein n=1 Tax=Eleginops maclovinus TaxID=56733 RepID=A0AAN7WWI2_ELEMC|nr:hypothetical protein PBY51_013998 [Eleginops maclovinus]
MEERQPCESMFLRGMVGRSPGRGMLLLGTSERGGWKKEKEKEKKSAEHRRALRLCSGGKKGRKEGVGDGGGGVPHRRDPKRPAEPR